MMLFIPNHDAAPRKEDLEHFVSVLRTFFGEIIESLRTMETMIDPASHSDICKKYLEFIIYRIPGSDAIIKDISLEGRAHGSSLRRALIRIVPEWLKSRLNFLYIFFWIFDLAFFPTDSVAARAALRRQLIGRVPSRLKSRLKILRWLDNTLLRRHWDHIPETGKPFWKFSSSEIELLAKRVAQANLHMLMQGRELARQLDSDPCDVYVLVTHVFPTTWSPFVRALNEKGNHTVWCGIDDPRTSEGYGVLETPLVGTTMIAILTFVGVLGFLCSVRRAQILMSGECFYGSNWNAEATTVLYSLLSSVLATMRSLRPARQNLNLIMYDGLKPINAAQSQKNSAISYYYKRLMSLGDRIIYNSNTELLGTFNEYAIPLKKPRLHFYRYSDRPVHPKPRINWGHGADIHMACITVCLEEFGEPSRDQTSQYVRTIIMQRIHFHYYCMTKHPVIQKFKRSLGEYERYLHLHPIIKDQARLVEDLHQYHVGFNPSDHVPFAHGIASLHDRFYQDAMSVFLQSTIGTSFLVYAAAGLPVILPRGCVGATSLLGDVAIPIVFSEMHNIRSILEECDLPRRMTIAESTCAQVHIDTHIERFLEFIKADCGK